MTLSPKLLEILACPDDKGPLYYVESEDLLYNPRLKRRYDVRDDIPVMLIDESVTVDDAEHDAIDGRDRARGDRADVHRLTVAPDHRAVVLAALMSTDRGP